jgi:hypothetical protein
MDNTKEGFFLLGLILPTFNKKLYCAKTPKAQKDTHNLIVLGAIQIIRDTIFFCQKKNQSQTKIREKLRKALLHKKVTCKTLIKLTPGRCKFCGKIMTLKFQG